MNSRFAHLLVLGVHLVLGAGCATRTHDVRVYSGGRTPLGSEGRQSYVIRDRRAADQPNLRQKEAIRHIKTALSGQGLYEATGVGTADLIVEIDYEISPQQVRIEVESIPIVKRVRSAAYTVTEQVATGKDGNGIFQTRTYREPDTTEVVGNRDVKVKVPYHEKTLRITARRNPAKGAGTEPEVVWHVIATSDDRSDDLRAMLPVLAGATIDYVARGTDGTVTVTVGDDGDVAFVKKGI